MWMSVGTGVWLPCLSCSYNVTMWEWDNVPPQLSREQLSGWLIITATSDFFVVVGWFLSWEMFSSGLLVCVVILILEVLVFVRAIIQTALLWWKAKKKVYWRQLHLPFVLCVPVVIASRLIGFVSAEKKPPSLWTRAQAFSLAPHWLCLLKHQRQFWSKHFKRNSAELHEGLNLEPNFISCRMRRGGVSK